MTYNVVLQRRELKSRMWIGTTKACDLRLDTEPLTVPHRSPGVNVHTHVCNTHTQTHTHTHSLLHPKTTEELAG